MPARSITVDRIKLAYEDQGAGRPVVLLHGFPLDRAMWQSQIAALSREFRVIAPDLRGFGGSQLAASDAEKGVAMDRYAADVLALLDALKIADPVVLAGFSMGGYAAWQFALKWPDRLAALIQCDTRAIADNDEGRAGREKMAAAALAAGDSSPALAMLPKLLAPDAEHSQPQTVAMVRTMIERQSAEAVAAAQRGMARREDVSGRLAEINGPVLCLAGAEDAISTPAEMREIAAALPNASFIEIPAAGHMTTMENPAAVTAAMTEFIRGL